MPEKRNGSMRTLEEVRLDIDQVDLDSGPLLGDYFGPRNASEHERTIAKLNELYRYRMCLVKEVGEIKAAGGIAAVQPGRRDQVMAVYEWNARSYAPHIDPENFRFIFSVIHEAAVIRENSVAAQHPAV